MWAVPPPAELVDVCRFVHVYAVVGCNVGIDGARQSEIYLHSVRVATTSRACPPRVIFMNVIGDHSASSRPRPTNQPRSGDELYWPPQPLNDIHASARIVPCELATSSPDRLRAIAQSAIRAVVAGVLGWSPKPGTLVMRSSASERSALVRVTAAGNVRRPTPAGSFRRGIPMRAT